MNFNFDAIDTAVVKTNTALPQADAGEDARKEQVISRIEEAFGVAFSAEQRAVIVHTNAPLGIISCAGSGKTTVIIAKLLFREMFYGVKPHNMLAITYSKKAAQELETRYAEAKRSLGLHTFETPTFKTFHALFYQLTARVMGNMKVAQEGAYMFPLMKIIPNSPLYDRKDMLQSILDYRSKLINNSLSTDGIMSSKLPNTQVPIENEPFKAETYYKVIYEYNRLKEARKEIDFDDMLVHMYRMTVETPNDKLITLFRQTYTELYIDEYQDSSEIIISILDVLTADINKLTIIGDDDQTIYSFRGSKDYYILNFQYRYPNARTLFLGDNYRCPSNILNPVISSIEQNKNRLPKNIRAFNTGGEVFFYPIHNSYEDLIDMILDEIDNGVGDLNSVAILVRVNTQKIIYGDLLATANIPVDIGSHYSSLRQNKVYQSILGIIDAIKSEDNELLSQHGRMFLPSVGYNVLQRYQNNHRDNWYVDIIEHNRYLVDEDTMHAIKTIKASNNAKDILRHVWVMVRGYYMRSAEKGYGNYDTTNEIVRYMANCAGTLTYAEFRRKEDEKETFLQSYMGVLNTIKINTYHAVKGLEFDSVYLVGLDNAIFPNEAHVEYLYNKSMNTQLREGELSPLETYLAEERRLFYVGWTRAKKRLVVAFNAKNPTCFIYEVNHPQLTQILQDLEAQKNMQ